MSSIAVVGLGKLGSCLAATMAAAGHRVYGVDTDERVVAAINAGRAPVIEPGLADLLALPDLALTATTNHTDAVTQADLTFVVVPTPSGSDGRFDPGAVLKAVRDVAWRVDRAQGPHTVVVCSTVMPGTMEGQVVPIVAEEASWRKVTVDVAYNPLFIALGSVLHDLAYPDLLLVGSDSHAARRAVLAAWRPIVGDAVDASLNFVNAELVKLAVNGFLCTKAAYANALAGACEGMPGADAATVLDAVGADSRIGRAFLRPGPRPGGPCLPRDSQALAACLADAGGRPELARAVAELNGRQVADIADWLAPLTARSRVAILGLAYKPGTPVWERSLGSDLACELARRGLEVVGHDPLARPPSVRLAATADEAVNEAAAVIVATAWPADEDVTVDGRPTLDLCGILRDQPGVRRLGRA